MIMPAPNPTKPRTVPATNDRTATIQKAWSRLGRKSVMSPNRWGMPRGDSGYTDPSSRLPGNPNAARRFRPSPGPFRLFVVGGRDHAQSLGGTGEAGRDA